MIVENKKKSVLIRPIISGFAFMLFLISGSCKKSNEPVLPDSFRPPEFSHPTKNDLMDLNFTMQEVVFHSDIMNKDMQLDISFIGEMQAGKKYPAIYLTDGYWRRADHKYIHYLTMQNLIPAVIVVGMGYTRGNDYLALREDDLHDEPEAFYDAIQNEIMPHMIKNYSVEIGKQILFGASYGGNFVLYNAFRAALAGDKPFYAYIAACPAFFNGMILGQLDRMLTQEKGFGLKIFTSFGEFEDNVNIVEPNRSLAFKIAGAAKSVFQFYQYEYPGKDHHTVTRPTLVDGVLLFLGEQNKRGLGFTDLDFNHKEFSFSSQAQFFDWDQSFCQNKSFVLDAEGNSLVSIDKDFSDYYKAYLYYAFPGSQNLRGHTISVRFKLEGPPMPETYFAFLVFRSTVDWVEDRSEGIKLTPGLWQNLEWKIDTKWIRGSIGAAEEVGFLIEKAGAETINWKGRILIDSISW